MRIEKREKNWIEKKEGIGYTIVEKKKDTPNSLFTHPSTYLVQPIVVDLI